MGCCDLCDALLCRRCVGTCCTLHVSVSETDIARLEKATGLSKEQFCENKASLVMQNVKEAKGKSEIEKVVKSFLSELFPKETLWRLKRPNEGFCIFHSMRADGTGYCTQYEHRPTTCREYHQNRCASIRKIQGI